MQTLEAILRMPALTRIPALNSYIKQGDESLTQARSARIRTVAELKNDADDAATWRRLADLTGLSEQHLRKAVASLPEKGNQPNA